MSAMPHTPRNTGFQSPSLGPEQEAGLSHVKSVFIPCVFQRKLEVRKFELGVGSVWAAVRTCVNAHVALDPGKLLPLSVFAFTLQPDPREDW